MLTVEKILALYDGIGGDIMLGDLTEQELRGYSNRGVIMNTSGSNLERKTFTSAYVPLGDKQLWLISLGNPPYLYAWLEALSHGF